MGSDIFSDSTFDLVFWSGLALLSLTLILFLLILFMRLSHFYKNKQRQKVSELWLPILKKAEAQEFPECIPPISGKDVLLFLSLWINLYEISYEGGREALVMVAIQAGADKYLPKLFSSGNARVKIMALTLAGAIRDEGYLPVFIHLLNSANPSLSLASARALLLTCPNKARPLLRQALIQRKDWPVARASMTFLELGIDVVIEALISAVSEADEQDLPRLISYFHIVLSSQALPVILNIINQHSNNETILLACLQAISKYSHFENRALLQRLLTHMQPMIRAEAAIALGKFGILSDGDYLMKLLSEDPSELVQYRAAQALLSLPKMDETKLTQIVRLLKYPHSKDMLTRVVAERRYRK